MQLDYQDCGYGLLGLLVQTDNIMCDWQTHYVNKPILDWVIASESESELYRSGGCESRTIVRYDAI